MLSQEKGPFMSGHPSTEEQEYYANSPDAAHYPDDERRRGKVGVIPWRSKERTRTVMVGLVLCLNIGVDPPDVPKPVPCARMETWIEPDSLAPRRALKTIGNRIQAQYERWQPRLKCRQLLDPTAEDVRKLCSSLRKGAGDERVLFHYNGHGVPTPTHNGELWVYNRTFTQYIPLSLYDVQQWMSPDGPAIYIFDCHAAGLVMDAFSHFLQQRRQQDNWATTGGIPRAGDGGGEEDDRYRTHSRESAGSWEGSGGSDEDDAIGGSSGRNGSGQDEQSQDRPASDEKHGRNADASPRMSGRQEEAEGGQDGRPGCTARTRGTEEDLVNQQCRTILLGACSQDQTLPLADPALPADLFTSCLTTPVKTALRWAARQSSLSGASLELIDQLPGIKKPNNRKTPFGELNWIFTAITDSIAWNVLPRPLFQALFRQDLLVASLFRNLLLAQRIFHTLRCTVRSSPALPPTDSHPLWEAWDLVADRTLAQLEHHHLQGTVFSVSPFFEEQLCAFEVWLTFGGSQQLPPMQLPIVLQVLLSQAHRLRALQLLARFLDLGPWAVNLGLSVGVFPYVLKLLQSPSRDLRQVLVFVWAKILALDLSCQADLVKGASLDYFVAHLRQVQYLSFLQIDR
eukprot:g44045.t1